MVSHLLVLTRVWADHVGAPREAQQIFPIRLTSAGEVDIARNTKIVSGHRVTVLPNVDPSPTNVSLTSSTWSQSNQQIVMAGVLHMSKQGKVYVPPFLFLSSKFKTDEAVVS